MVYHKKTHLPDRNYSLFIILYSLFSISPYLYPLLCI